MAISKKGFRKIEIDGQKFFWKVRKKISHEEWHDDQYAIPIQHESEGQLLLAYVGYCRSGYPERDSFESITPKIIRECIIDAVKLGWQYNYPGKPISLLDGKLSNDTRRAKWSVH